MRMFPVRKDIGWEFSGLGRNPYSKTAKFDDEDTAVFNFKQDPHNSCMLPAQRGYSLEQLQQLKSGELINAGAISMNLIEHAITAFAAAAPKADNVIELVQRPARVEPEERRQMAAQEFAL